MPAQGDWNNIYNKGGNWDLHMEQWSRYQAGDLNIGARTLAPPDLF